jgi:DNA-binding transcriptional MerR regulator
MAEKLYKIGEAAELLKLKTYVLRFWEMEFPQLAPTRTQTGQRMYTEQNLAVLKRIRHLLHERGLTIEGARKLLAEDERRSTVKARRSLANQASTLFEACDMLLPDQDERPEKPEPASRARRKAPARPSAPGTAQAEMSAPEMQALVEELRALRDMLASRDKDYQDDGELPAAAVEDTRQ